MVPALAASIGIIVLRMGYHLRQTVQQHIQLQVQMEMDVQILRPDNNRGCYPNGKCRKCLVCDMSSGTSAAMGGSMGGGRPVWTGGAEVGQMRVM